MQIKADIKNKIFITRVISAPNIFSLLTANVTIKKARPFAGFRMEHITNINVINIIKFMLFHQLTITHIILYIFFRKSNTS